MSSDTEWIDAWNEQAPQKDKPAGSSGYVPVPDGTGHVSVIKSVTGRVNDKGRTILLNYYFPAQNTDETEYLNFTPKSAKAIKAKLYYLGLEQPSSNGLTVDQHFAAVTAEFKKAEGWTIETEKKSRKVGGKWYRDYYIQKVLDKTAAPAEPATPTVDDSWVPF